MTTKRQLNLVWNEKVLGKDEKCATELVEQILFATWLDKMGLKYYAVPNGGWRTMSEGLKFKRSGVKSGVPDVCIPLPVEPYHGLYIELKRVKGGVVSETQKEWIEYLNSVGYRAVVCKGFAAARLEVEYYLDLMPKKLA
jgi:hypothetical protein